MTEPKPPLTAEEARMLAHVLSVKALTDIANYPRLKRTDKQVIAGMKAIADAALQGREYNARNPLGDL